MTESQRLATCLRDAGLPVPKGKIIRLRFNMQGEAWYAKLSTGWLYLDVREGKSTHAWVPCPMGPPHENP